MINSMNDRKKILIVNNNMHIGGVQKSLLNLLWNLQNQYEITLLLFYQGGEYLSEIPPEIKVVSDVGEYRYLGMNKTDVKSISEKWKRFFYAGISRTFGRKYAIKIMSICHKKRMKYDVAISYLHNSADKVFYGGCNEFVLNHVEAKKKIAFLHCDYHKCGADTKENKQQLLQFDRIAACSQGCADSFLESVPEIKGKVRVVRNSHHIEDILQKATEAPVTLKRNSLNVVTVARLGKEKGVERALRAIAMMGEEKRNMHYYVIGDGIQMPLLKQIIEEKDLSGVVTLCGMRTNPYGYIRAADLLLIPSYSEAAPLVIGEAALLGTPVLSTETSSAKEMIEDTGYGWVCENSERGISETLSQILFDRKDDMHKKKAREQVEEENQLSIHQFIQCMEE